MTTAEAAQHFNVSERTIRRWIQSGKLHAERTNGQWAVRVSECPSDREPIRVDARLSETDDRVSALVSENASLKEKLRQSDFEIAHISEGLEEKTFEIQRLHEFIDRRDEQIESLTRALDQAQQLLAVQTKTNASLTDRLHAIEDHRKRRWWQLFRRS